MSRALLLAAAAAAAAAQQPTLTPLKYLPLKTGSVMPTGWLYRELRLQGDGMSGHFQEFWEPVQNTVWLGGNSKTEDWTEVRDIVRATRRRERDGRAAGWDAPQRGGGGGPSHVEVMALGTRGRW